MSTPSAPASTPSSTSAARPTLRRSLGALLALLAATFLSAGLVAATAGTANAADGYRYWNYSHLEGDTFTFAQTGPGDFKPKDGDVEGWRYGTSTVSQGIFPRADLGEVSFDTVCADAEADKGQKRVAVLVDYGTEADAGGAEIPEPRAECATVPAKATGQQVLESVVDVRQENGMICALDGYPAQGCGAQVKNAKVSADEEAVPFAMPASAEEETQRIDSDEPAQSAVPLVAVVVVVLVLAAIAVPLYRRKRAA